MARPTPKPSPTKALAPVLPDRPRIKAPKVRYSGTDTAKWNVRTFAGEVLASGLDGFKAASKRAAELGRGVAVRA